jgi:hypothetical protein
MLEDLGDYELRWCRDQRHRSKPTDPTLVHWHRRQHPEQRQHRLAHSQRVPRWHQLHLRRLSHLYIPSPLRKHPTGLHKLLLRRLLSHHNHHRRHQRPFVPFRLIRLLDDQRAGLLLQQLHRQRRHQLSRAGLHAESAHVRVQYDLV